MVGGKKAMVMVMVAVLALIGLLAYNAPSSAIFDQATDEIRATLHSPVISSSSSYDDIDSSPPQQLPDTNSSSNPYLAYLPRHYQSRKTSPPLVVPGYRESFPPAPTGKCATHQLHLWKTCDAPQCNLTSSPRVSLKRLRIPRTATKHNIDTITYLQEHVLRKAWGEDPPMIDLYVRAGCRGAQELHYMLHTLVLFFPRFLGDIIIVLDVNDHPAVDFILPRALLVNHSVHVVFEHQPCMLGRIFNQYSYLNLYRHTQAEFVVTIDSDCAFHRPVTPDVLFSRKGKLVLPTHSAFQSTYWFPKQFYFTKIDDRAWGHSMVSQPVAFRVETFTEYFAFVEAKHGNSCYEAVLGRFYHEYSQQQQQQQQEVKAFCWMCQLSAYVGAQDKPGGKSGGYDVHDANRRRNQPYLRYASHVTYDMPPGEQATYEDAVRMSTVQGLCLWFGDQVFAECGGGTKMKKKKTMDVSYAKQLLFTYAHFNLNSHSSHAQLQFALHQAQARLRVFL